MEFSTLEEFSPPKVSQSNFKNANIGRLVVKAAKIGVGTSSFVSNIVEGEIDTSNVDPSVVWHSVDKEVTSNGKQFLLKIQYEMRERLITDTEDNVPYKTCHCIILMFDLTDNASFQDLKIIGDFVNLTVPPSAEKYLVGNKLDLADKRDITFEEASVSSFLIYNISFTMVEFLIIFSIGLCK